MTSWTSSSPTTPPIPRSRLVRTPGNRSWWVRVGCRWCRPGTRCVGCWWRWWRSGRGIRWRWSIRRWMWRRIWGWTRSSGSRWWGRCGSGGLVWVGWVWRSWGSRGRWMTSWTSSSPTTPPTLSPNPSGSLLPRQPRRWWPTQKVRAVPPSGGGGPARWNCRLPTSPSMPTGPRRPRCSPVLSPRTTPGASPKRSPPKGGRSVRRTPTTAPPSTSSSTSRLAPPTSPTRGTRCWPV